MKNGMVLTREFYNKKRKWFFIFDKRYNTLVKPSWMRNNNDRRFEVIYTDQKLLFKKGKIMLGRIVQANSMLFKPGKYDCPAAMIFTEDTFFEENPQKLGEIASNLFEIKGKATEDEELQKFSDILADEMVPVFNIDVPDKITYGKKVYFTTFMVIRKHLPVGYISNNTFPILACPEETEATIILPSKYWAPELKDAISRLNA